MSERVLIQLDELRVALRGSEWRQHLRWMDCAIADNNCNAVLCELEQLSKWGDDIQKMIIGCHNAVTQLRSSGGFVS